MTDNISLGKGRKAPQIELYKLQNSIAHEAKPSENGKGESIFTDNEKKIFAAYDQNGGANGVLDNEEMAKFLSDIKSAAGNNKLSKREANKFLKEHGLKDIDAKTLFSFVQKLSQSSENIKSCQMDAEGNIVIEYNDDKTETVSTDKTSTVTSKDENENEVTEKYDADRNLTSKTVVSDEGKTAVTTSYENGKQTQITTEKDGGATKITTTLDENEKPATEVETQGQYTEIHREYVNGEARTTSKTENKGLDTQKDTTYEYAEDGTVTEKTSELGGTKQTTTVTKDDVLISQKIVEEGKTTELQRKDEGGYTETVTDGETVIQNELNDSRNRLSQIKTVGGSQYQLAYDGEGNTTGIIVQHGESPAAIAQKFGVPVDKLREVNADKLDKNNNFNVGDEIKIPREMEADEKVLQGRKDSQGAKDDYAQYQARVQAQRAAKQARIAAENKVYKSLGLKNRKGARTIINDTKGNRYTVVGQAGFARTIATDGKGNIHVIAHDGVDLKTSYVKADISNIKAGKKRITVNGRVYYTDGKARDRHGRMTVTDWTGKQSTLSGGKSKTDLSDRKILNNGYVQASDARDYAKDTKTEQGTLSGGKNVTQYKDNSGRIWYFDEKTGKALVKGQYSEFVNKEAKTISDQMYDAAKGMGTDEEKLENAVSYIKSPEMFAKVNAHVATKHSDYTPTADKTAVEALILDEVSHGEAQEKYFSKLINSGAMTTKQAGTCIARELEHEVHGRDFGYTSTEGVNRVMNLCQNRETRLEVESQLAAKHSELKPNEGSYTRAYLEDDGWTPQEVDQFDSNWVANNAYTQATYQTDENGNVVKDANGNPVIKDMGDQAHRNKVIGRLCFEYDSKEALHKGLKAMSDDVNSQDYVTFSKQAVAENKKRGYVQQFSNQECVQQYLAGRATDDGKVDVPQLSACNTLLFKNEKPARVQAEESLYGAKNGDMSHVFDSMDAEVYAEQQKIFAKGDIKGCKNVQEAYTKAMAQAKDDEKTFIKANAILSNQVQFSQKDITDFTISLMHSIDKNRGRGASTGYSAGYSNDAETQTEQLKAILTNHPEVIADVKARMQKEKFEYTTTVSEADGPTSIYTTDTKKTYLDIINNTNTSAKEAVFYDANGNKITDPAQIQALTKANMDSLSELRKYVGELEREYKMGIDEEGIISDAADGLVRYSGLGTDRGDVANKYKEAKRLLNELELAAQGKLRDSSGKVISAQQLAKKVQDNTSKLAQTNADYKSSVEMAKMGIVLAPVIVATVAATTVFTGGTGTVALVAAASTLAAEGTLNAVELGTSETGNTAENRASATQQTLADSAMAGLSAGVGKYAENIVGTALKGVKIATVANVPKSKMPAFAKALKDASVKFDNAVINKGSDVLTRQFALMQKVAPKMTEAQLHKASVILARAEAAGFEVSSDMAQSLASTYALNNGEFDEASFTQGLIMSIAGNTIGHVTSGAKELKSSPKVPAPEPQGIHHATGNGTHPSGGKLNPEKMDVARKEVREVAKNGTPKEVAQVHKEADLQQAQSRAQGRELKHIVEDEAGFVSIGKKRIPLDSSNLDDLAQAKKEVSGWADGTRGKDEKLAQIEKRMAEIRDGQVKPTKPSRANKIVEEINENVNSTSEKILEGKTGAIGSHDAATLRDQLTNNVKTEADVEQFIADIRERVGVDEKGRMHVYQVQGKDHAADLVKQAEAKLKNIKAHKADMDQVTKTLDDAISANKGLSEDGLKTVRAFSEKTKSPEELQTLIDKMSAKSIKRSSAAKKLVKDMQEKLDILKAKEAASFTQTVKPKETATPASKVDDTPASKVDDTPAPKADDTPASKVDDTPAPKAEEALASKVDDAPAPKAEAKADVEVEITPQKVESLKKESVALDKEINASSEIPAQQKQLWKSVKEKYETVLDSVKSMTSGLKTGANGISKYCKDVLQGLESIAKTAPKAIKEKLTKMMNNVKALMSNISSKINAKSINKGVLGTNPRLDKYVINPNKPAMKISREAKEYANACPHSTPEHIQFHMDNKELFNGNNDWDCWSVFEAKNQKHGAWKMHMYSVNEEDWKKMSEVLIPYLRDNDIDWKTFNRYYSAEFLNGDVQEGKAFTIYPRDNAHMEQIARDLDYIIRNNKLETSGSNIVGDRAMGDNGRLFYRYEYKSGAMKDDVLDLANDTDKTKYLYAYYDSNDGRVQRHGEGRYLADDMTAADDPWLNFNPADPESHAILKKKINDEGKLNKDVMPIAVESNQKVKETSAPKTAETIIEPEMANLDEIESLGFSSSNLDIEDPMAMVPDFEIYPNVASPVQVGKKATTPTKTWGVRVFNRIIQLEAPAGISREELFKKAQSLFMKSFKPHMEFINNTSAQNPAMKNFIEKKSKMSPYFKERMLLLDQALEMVNNPSIKKYVETRLNTLATGKCSVKDLDELVTLVDATNEFTNKYSHLRNVDLNGNMLGNSDISKFSKYLKEQGISMESIGDEVPSQLKRGQISLKRDLVTEQRLYSVKQYIKGDNNPEISNYLYNMYLEKSFSHIPNVQEALSNIDKKYNVKIFLPARFSKKQFEGAIKYIDDELSQWLTASQGKAKLPPLIDFNTVKRSWYDTSSAYGMGASNAYSETATGSLAFSSINKFDVKCSLRHELTHSNDLTRQGWKIPAAYDVNAIMPRKVDSAKGKTFIDFEKCKYVEEFRNAGIPESRIPYAYNNPAEFIARASEGDMSKYSDEFKEILKAFGMPEWMFSLKGEIPTAKVQ